MNHALETNSEQAKNYNHSEMKQKHYFRLSHLYKCLTRENILERVDISKLLKPNILERIQIVFANEYVCKGAVISSQHSSIKLNADMV